MMKIVLGDAKHRFVLWYLDDINVLSLSFEEHIEHVTTVLELMPAVGITVLSGKVQLATDKIDLLGFVIDNGTLRPNPDKLQAIIEYPQPHEVECLQRFLGMLAF